MRNRRRAVAIVPILVMLLLATYCYARYAADQAWLAQKARTIVKEAGARTRREQVFALRDYIRRHVRYEGVSQEGRPFLRDTARRTLECGRGYCGEATRALVNLTAQLGIPAQRVNLYGRINHVVAEVELDPGTYFLVDPQDNQETNPYLDSADRHLDEVIGCSNSLFSDYSNLHLRRVPFVSRIIQRVRLNHGLLTWTAENPWLILADVCFLGAITNVLILAIDRVLLKIYSMRLGI